MKQPLTVQNIRDLLTEKELKQKDLGPILSLSPSNLSNIMSGVRKISESEQKLLRLYFFGEIPFENLGEGEDWSDVLCFSAQESDSIRSFANRVGISPEHWIAEQIRTIISVRRSEFDSLTIHPLEVEQGKSFISSQG